MKKSIRLLLAMGCLTIGAVSGQAAVKYWDINADAAGAGGATPNGTWDTGTTTNWTSDAAGLSPGETWTAGDSAVFSADTDASGTFTVTLDGDQDAQGITFEEGEVTLAGGSITMSLSPFPVDAIVDGTIASDLSGTALTKTGAGVLTLSGANAHTGLTTVSVGVVVVGNNAALGDSSGTTLVSNGAQLQLAGGILLIPESIQLIGTGGGTGSLRHVSGSNVITGTLTMGTASPVGQSGRINSDSGTLFIAGNINGGANSFKLTVGGAGDTVVNAITFAGTGGHLVKDGSGTLTVSGNTNHRQFTAVNDGTMKAGRNGPFDNSGGAFSDLLMASAGVFDLNGFRVTVDNLGGSAGSLVTNSTGTVTNLVLGAGGNAFATSTNNFFGVIAGPIAVEKTGGGTQILSGDNTYDGTTTVSAGTLLINGALAAASEVSVASGATLGGSGTIGGSVTVAAGGRVVAGTSPGTLTVGNGLDLSAGGTNVWELAANSTDNPGVDFDQIVLSGGDLVLGGSSSLEIRFTGSATAPDWSEPFWQSARSWTVISMSGGANPGSSDFTTIMNGSYDAGDFSTSVDGGGNVILSFTPTPPPLPEPLITSLDGAGTTTVVINYTNTVLGTNYVVQYRTNFNTTNWTDLGPVTAPGTSSSTTDNPPANDPHRFYRVYFVTP